MKNENNKYTTNRNNKPNLKKCEDCGAYGQPNRTCKFWAYDSLTEWSCCHPQIKKVKVLINESIKI